MKFWRSLIVCVLISSLFSFISTQSSNGGIETDSYCAVDFQNDVAVQPVNSAFTFEMKYALAYDDNWQFVTNTNSNGGVLTGNHTTLVGTSDTTGGLQVYYNTNWLADNSVLFFMGKGRSGKFHYFNNPDWKFPNFTKSEGSSPYVHIAVVRDSSNRLTVFFNGKAPTKSWTGDGESGGYEGNWSSSSYVTDVNSYTTARYVGYDSTYNSSVNPKSYISGIKFVTGHNLYNPTSSTISTPSNTTIRTVSDTGSTPILLNSLRAPTVVTNSGNASLSDSVMKAFGGSGCPAFVEDSFIGGDGVYNVYYKEGTVTKDSGTAPKRRDFYYSEDSSPTALTIPTAGSMIKANNTFIGWNTQSDGYGQTYRAGTSYRPTNNITLYTKWSTPKTVTYYNGGGTGTLPTESNKLWEDTFTVAANTLTNGVLNFIGWNDGNGNTYGPGATFTVVDSNASLTAQWSNLTTISTANVAITAPVAGAVPVSSTTSNGQYTTAITWSDSPVTFAYNTVYTATVTVTPDASYTLTGVKANLFTVNGNAATSANSLNAGVFTYQFPRTALGTALNPTFGTVTQTNGGFTVPITNYDPAYTWATPTVSPGSVAVTSTDGANRLLTVTGLSPGASATITQTTTRTNYAGGTGSVIGTALSPLNPTFNTPTRTADGFTVTITNYDSNYTWATPSVLTGSVAVTSTDGANRVLTVTGLSAAASATITQETSRSGYPNGSNTVSGTALGAGLTPTFGAATRTVGGFTLQISNHSASYNWSGTNSQSGSVSISGSGLVTVTGLAGGTASTVTITATRDGYVSGSATSDSATSLTVISTANVTITAPVTGDTPVASLSSNGQFTTAITWSPVRATFAANTVYTATVTVTPVAGYTLTGVTANFFTVNGNAATSANSANAGVFTFTFPETAIIITEPNVTITAPVTGATPVTSLSSNGQYTTAISWSGSPTTFASNTIYTATVTVTPISGYTLTGVAAGLFTINSGAPTTANLINAGSFTKTFPVTATTISTAAIAITAPATGATPVASTTSTQYNTTITWSSTPSRFNATTAYTATITITPNAGYTLAGVTANFFTVTGATVTNLANSATVTAVFGATGAKLPQTITFAQPAGMSCISANQSLTPTTSATGGYSVTLTVNSSSSICQLSGNAVEQKALGTCSITASQAGDGIYAAATSITRTFTISKATQNITFTQPSAMVRSSENQILVASSSGGAGYVITLATTTPTYCDIVDGKVRVKKWPGTCSISASNAGDLIYAAGSTSRSFTISKDPQTITFTQPTTMSLSSSNQNLVATSSASLTPVVFTSNTGTCAITDSNKVSVVSAGTCTITASQAGNDNYAASTATRSFTITKKTQTITFTQPNNMARTSANQSLSATSTSGLAITFSSLTPSICSVVSGMIKVNGAGPCYIAADQSGNTTWGAAFQVVRTILITRS